MLLLNVENKFEHLFNLVCFILLYVKPVPLHPYHERHHFEYLEQNCPVCISCPTKHDNSKTTRMSSFNIEFVCGILFYRRY